MTRSTAAPVVASTAAIARMSAKNHYVLTSVCRKRGKCMRLLLLLIKVRIGVVVCMGYYSALLALLGVLILNLERNEDLLVQRSDEREKA